MVIDLLGDVCEEWIPLVTQAVQSEDETLQINICSLGGCAFTGLTIANIIKNSGKETIANIMGICASAATVITSACKTVTADAESLFMIHRPSTCVAGTIDDMANAMNTLSAIADSSCKIYADKTGIEIDEITKMISFDNWMLAEDAMSLGFINSINKTQHNEGANMIKMSAVLDSLKKFIVKMSADEDKKKEEEVKAEEVKVEETKTEEAPAQEVKAECDEHKDEESELDKLKLEISTLKADKEFEVNELKEKLSALEQKISEFKMKSDLIAQAGKEGKVLPVQLAELTQLEAKELEVKLASMKPVKTEVISVNMVSQVVDKEACMKVYNSISDAKKRQEYFQANKHILLSK